MAKKRNAPSELTKGSAGESSKRRKSTESTETPFRLLDLPREVRDLIYSHVVSAKTRWLIPLDKRSAQVVRQMDARRAADAKRYGFILATSFPRIQIFECGLLFANSQIYHEVRSIMVQENGIRLNDFNLRNAQMRARLKEVLSLAKSVDISVTWPDQKSWWVQLLQKKTNLDTLRVYINSSDTYCRRWEENWKVLRGDIRALSTIKPRENGQVVYSGRRAAKSLHGLRPQQWWNGYRWVEDISEDLQEFITTEVSSKMPTKLLTIAYSDVKWWIVPATKKQLAALLS